MSLSRCAHAQGTRFARNVSERISFRSVLRCLDALQREQSQMNRKGFTLIELLIVVVIIGILAAIAIPKFANTKGKAYIASMKSDLRNLVTAEEAFFADSVKYSTNVTSKVGGTCPAPAAGQVNWCPTTGNNLTGPAGAGGGLNAAIPHNNLTGNYLVTCSIYINEAADPLGIATTEGAPACK